MGINVVGLAVGSMARVGFLVGDGVGVKVGFVLGVSVGTCVGFTVVGF